MNYPKGTWNLQQVSLAVGCATQAHGEQRYGSYPYSKHLSDVAAGLDQTFLTLPINEELQYALFSAAWLHDTLEDTGLTKAEIATFFGDEMASVIHALSGEGGNRTEKFANVCSKLDRLQTLSPFAITVKLADRIANVESCWATESPLLFMYKKEYPVFRENLFSRSGLYRPDADLPLVKALWNRLDENLGWRR